MTKELSEHNLQFAETLVGDSDVEIWFDENIGKYVIQVGDEDCNRHFLAEFQPTIEDATREKQSNCGGNCKCKKTVDFTKK